jgi:Ca-activated chloride channel family protein
MILRWLIHVFERPTWLAVLPVIAVILALNWLWARRNTKQFPNCLLSRPNRSLSPIALALAMALFTLAAAGPRGDEGELIALASGQDIVAVVDLSRSMTARDAMPDRVGRSNELLQQFVTQLERRGCCRVAVVAFASQPVTICPLTFDLGHVHQKVESLTPNAYPDVYAANAVSGTRIGAALIYANSLLAVGQSNARRIILLSDGDDPSRDGEWRRGLNLGVPINVIGIGNPDRDSTIPGIASAATRLQEGPLRELAAQTGGKYIADFKAVTEMNGFLTRILTRTQDKSDSVNPELAVSRAPAKPAGFLIAGLVFLTLGLTGLRWRPAIISATAFAIAAGPIDDWLRRGNAELAAGRAESALNWYAKAAERTPDPGQVAFNQGVALAALGRFREAELHFRRSLSDAEGERRAKALFNLGTCLVRRCGGVERKALSDAVAAYQQAVPLADSTLADEVKTNLHIAERLLAQAPAESPERQQTPESTGEGAPKCGTSADNESSDKTNVTGQPGKERRPVQSKERNRDTNATPPPGKGNLPPLPDDETLAPILPEDLAAHLDRIEMRIAAAKQDRMKAKIVKPNPNYPDW